VAKPNAANHPQQSYKQRSLYRKFVVAQAPTTISPSLPLMAQNLLTTFPYQTVDGPFVGAITDVTNLTPKLSNCLTLAFFFGSFKMNVI
jgi:hypothetical protein